MLLVERHVIQKNHHLYESLNHLCWLSKNLYNATLYTIRQHYFSVKQNMTYNVVNKLFTDIDELTYRALPAKVAKQTQMLVGKNFVSFFKLLKLYNQNKLENRPNVPNYLDSKHGRFVTVYPKDALSFTEDNKIKLSKVDVYISTKCDKRDIRMVRIVPVGNHIIIEVVYNSVDQSLKSNKHMQYCIKVVNEDNKKSKLYGERFASIDLGIDNLATVTSNVFSPFIVNGKPLKSINQYANKLVAHTQSLKKPIQSIFDKRKFKIDDYLHKASHYIINQLVSNNIDTLVIGHTIGWKQEVNMGRVNNQKFVQIPFDKFIHQLTYKALQKGIQVVYQEESYTSKSSFLSQDELPVYNKLNASNDFNFSGKRIKRGLYFDKKLNKTINADVNGSLNILRKFLNVAWNAKIFADCVEVCSSPIVKYTVPIH